MRDLVPELKGSPHTLRWLSPVLHIPPELQKDVTVVDLPLPAESEYRQVLDRLVEQVRSNPTVTVDLDDDAIDVIVKACQGLPSARISHGAGNDASVRSGRFQRGR